MKKSYGSGILFFFLQIPTGQPHTEDWDLSGKEWNIHTILYFKILCMSMLYTWVCVVCVQVCLWRPEVSPRCLLSLPFVLWDRIAHWTSHSLTAGDSLDSSRHCVEIIITAERPVSNPCLTSLEWLFKHPRFCLGSGRGHCSSHCLYFGTHRPQVPLTNASCWEKEHQMLELQNAEPRHVLKVRIFVGQGQVHIAR